MHEKLSFRQDYQGLKKRGKVIYISNFVIVMSINQLKQQVQQLPVTVSAMN